MEEKLFVIAIPSKGRAEKLERFFKKNYREDIKFVIAIDCEEKEEYESRISLTWTDIISLNKSGVGYARQKLAEYAIKEGYKFIVFVDDNSKFSIDKVQELVNVINSDNRIWWLGGYSKIYDLFFDAKKYSDAETFKVKFANSGYVIRTEILQKENFDGNCFGVEDCDLNLRLKKLAYPNNPIFCYKGFKYEHKRKEQGGCTDNYKKEKLIQLCKYLNEKHGAEIFLYNEKRNDIKVFWNRYMKLLINKNQLNDGKMQENAEPKGLNIN